MAPYLTVADFKTRSTMPGADVDYLETKAAGFIAARIAIHQSRIEARLRKRYPVAFSSPVSEIVLGWIVDLVTLDAWIRRGVDPNDPQTETYRQAATTALEEIKESADSENGLLEIPKADGDAAGAVDRGGPSSYSEAGPYAWTSAQAATARDEDRNGGGSFG